MNNNFEKRLLEEMEKERIPSCSLTNEQVLKLNEIVKKIFKEFFGGKENE